MQLSTKRDINVPIEHVFAAFTDFDGFARQALRRGAEVQRVDTLDGPCAGMGWNVTFDFRGKRRKMKITLTELDAPSRLTAQSKMSGLESELRIELLAMSRKRTRVSIELDLRPQTLSARLLVQSLKLARSNLTKRLGKKLDTFARATEESYNASA